MRTSVTPLRLAGIGCGARTQTYLRLAAQLPHLYEIVGAADPVPARLAAVREFCRVPAALRTFHSGAELLAQDKFADVVIVGTQDADHKQTTLQAMERGYDILLEKPIATTLPDVLAIERRARELGRKVLVCHVLRYTPFYQKLKELVSSGLIGEIVSLNATEGVKPWHQAHSYVRGQWAVVKDCSPMIVAKSCHDLDIITWLLERTCRRVSSYGGLTYFKEANAPAGAPLRCTDGCPAGAICPYNALLYTNKHRLWLAGVMDGAAAASQEEIVRWLQVSPWGRCVYRSDNTAVDHQVVAMEFEGGATATFTMTAFESDRHIEIFGTRGVLRAGEAVRAATGSHFSVRLHHSDETMLVKAASLQGGYEGHGGGDMGIMLALHEEMRRPESAGMLTSLEASVQSHVIGFAAESSRLNGCAVQLPDFAQAS